MSAMPLASHFSSSLIPFDIIIFLWEESELQQWRIWEKIRRKRRWFNRIPIEKFWCKFDVFSMVIEISSKKASIPIKNFNGFDGNQIPIEFPEESDFHWYLSMGIEFSTRFPSKFSIFFYGILMTIKNALNWIKILITYRAVIRKFIKLTLIFNF